MTAEEIIHELSTLGSPSVKKVLMTHGAKEPFYGVKIGDLKQIQKRVKKNHELALQLYESGISDAMYLAGLIAEPAKMTEAQLQKWVKAAYWYMLSEYTVAWVTAESRFATVLAKEWQRSPKEMIAAAGWSTYSSFVAITPDEKLNLIEIEKLLSRIPQELPGSPDRVRYTMNGFVISTGGYIAPLLAKAKAAAKAIGKVKVDMGGTSCKVPDALAYIEKIERMGRVGAKRKTAMC
jgi:3-methyladenine DNA glycosylase AlkD